MRSLLCALLVVVLSGCSVSSPSRAQIGPNIVRMAPDSAFAAVEQILLGAEHLAADQVEAQADSAFRVHLVGSLRLGPGNRVRVRADGVFVDFAADAHLRLVSDGRRMVGGRSAEVGFDTAAPRALREALAVGFMRMGLLHNLVRLYTGTPPDHAEGGAAEWVETHGFEWLPETTVYLRPARPLRFTVRVEGEDTAEATLYLDAATGLPLLRTQTVEMEMASGRMVVEERYSGWTDQPAAEEDPFSLESDPFE
jgi:hypothetical protein